MTQLLLHLIGDYVTQTDWMAREKAKSHYAAFCHAAVYALPFLLLSHISLAAWLTIFGTHFLIDRYRLARYVVFAKNWTTDRGLKWADCVATGYPKETPPWMAVWLMIAVDNTLHLTINWAALNWL